MAVLPFPFKGQSISPRKDQNIQFNYQLVKARLSLGGSPQGACCVADSVFLLLTAVPGLAKLQEYLMES